MEIESPEEILIHRKAVELELIDLLQETKSVFTIDDIKEIIYNEEGQDALTDIVAMFDTGQDMTEFENILDTVNDAWNYFPHKIIGGLSPVEILNSARNK